MRMEEITETTHQHNSQQNHTVTTALRLDDVVVANFGVKVQLLQALRQTSLGNGFRIVLFSAALPDFRYRVHVLRYCFAAVLRCYPMPEFQPIFVKQTERRIH
mgnify:CR=1 FL=1